MGIVVAIDGPAGSGKGTITKLVAKKLGLVNIDTGAMYRCVTLYMIKNHISLEDIEKIEIMLKNIQIEFKKENDVEKVFLNGEEVTNTIREKEINEIVSQVSHIPIIRQNMSSLQREMGLKTNVIMEGRDIGTNVFPDADVKIYLDASAEERANRRLKQNIEKGINIPYEEILENIKFRDHNDKTSAIAPLKQAEDAIYLDTSKLNIEEVTEEVIKIINEGLNKKGKKI